MNNVIFSLILQTYHSCCIKSFESMLKNNQVYHISVQKGRSAISLSTGGFVSVSVIITYTHISANVQTLAELLKLLRYTDVYYT